MKKNRRLYPQKFPHFNEINIYSLVNEYTICVISSANIFTSVAMLPKSSIVKTVKRNVKSDKRESNETSTSIGSIFNMPTWKINLWHQNKTNSGDLARFMRFSGGRKRMDDGFPYFRPDYQIWNVVNVCVLNIIACIYDHLSNNLFLLRIKCWNLQLQK